ncbi:hypothetical protein Hte_012438 [Hypoxylon texense]
MGSPISPFSTRPGGSVTAGTAIAIIRVLLALAPVALPAAYLVFLKRELAKHTIIAPTSTSTLSSASTKTEHDYNYEDGDDLIPPSVRASPDQFVVSRERVTSRAIPVSALGPRTLAADADADADADAEGLDDLLETYLRATMRAFSRTPPALVMARTGAGAGAGAASVEEDPVAYAESFREAYLRACTFQAGDRVCGVYVVRARRGDRVVLDLAPPAEGWRGPVARGALGVGFEWVRERDGERGGDGSVRFVNETVLWRRVEEKATMLEGRVGRWMHGLLAGWLVVKGVEAVTDGEARCG